MEGSGEQSRSAKPLKNNTTMTSIYLTDAGNNNPVGHADVAKWQPSPGGQAEPTGRVLSGSSDSWAAEEWAESGLYDGQRAARIYLFTAVEVEAAGDDASNLPWDDEHTARIKLQ
jgi:hypothetical protein